MAADHNLNDGATVDYQSMFFAAVKALADIDALLGLPEDGCNDPQVTVSALADYMAGAAETANFRDQWVDAQYAGDPSAAAGLVSMNGYHAALHCANELKECGFYRDEEGEPTNAILDFLAAVRACSESPSSCVDCGGTGLRDSGGIHPWGEEAQMPCECDHKP